MITMSSLIVTSKEFSPSSNMIFTKPKANNAGGKSVGILNSISKKISYGSNPIDDEFGV